MDALVVLESLLYIAAIILCLIGWIWMIVKGFEDNPGWGVGAIIIPLIGFVYGCINWAKCKTPMIIWIIGMVLVLIAYIAFFSTMITDGAVEAAEQQSS